MTIRPYHHVDLMYGTTATTHYDFDRSDREQLIKNVIGIGNIIQSFEVDKGHQNGLEIHQITTTGIILVYNRHSRKLVTKLIARPEQIARYFCDCKFAVPYSVLQIAMEHEQKGYNRI